MVWNEGVLVVMLTPLLVTLLVYICFLLVLIRKRRSDAILRSSFFTILISIGFADLAGILTVAYYFTMVTKCRPL